MAADTAPAAYEIELVDMNMTRITTLSSDDIDWGAVKQVTECMEDGLLKGVPRAREDENGIRIERFHLVVGNRPLAHGLHVLDHFERPIRYPLRIQLIKSAYHKSPFRDPSTSSSEEEEVFGFRCIRADT